MILLMTRDGLQHWAEGPSVSEACWWCGAPATTAEHRFKASSLRRAATNDDGKVVPTNLFKSSERFRGDLRSLRKGAEVRWPPSLCAPCNNDRSQPFDRALDQFETFVLTHLEVLGRWRRLTWADVYGPAWEQDAAHLARYFGKQMGCMLAAYRLPMPDELIQFLDGSPQCPTINFTLARNWRGIQGHKLMCAAGGDGLETFFGLLPATRYETDGATSGLDYGYFLAYIWVRLEWRDSGNFTGWWESPAAPLPLANGDLGSRWGWWRVMNSYRERPRTP
ncbi:hypothetical protein [Janibacter indicus]|uniref:hypothetical protein n=1 Tax=Janibacter indicus TaxID=857417 RepID=UPI00117AEEB4|nr:hypothetical protein [Janibacter indicus]